MTLPTSALDYELPPDRIAQYPTPRRDESRLLVLDRQTGDIAHVRFGDLASFLRRGDALIVNTTRVRRARLLGVRRTGGRVEALLLRPDENGSWQCLLRPAGRLQRGEVVSFEQGLEGRIEHIGDGGMGRIHFANVQDMDPVLDRVGHTPLPPYIDRADTPDDVCRYQTVYARELGAVAAPTAGLHFTEDLLRTLDEGGVQRGDVLLHVGPGTFRPVTTARIEQHRLDAEWYRVPASTRALLHTTRSQAGRVVAVGTTTVRTLETLARQPAHDGPDDIQGWSDLLISPPFDFKSTDVLLTNFHLPRSSLLALVAAFAGLDTVLDAYRTAVRLGYRFYSYGDAMLIL